MSPWLLIILPFAASLVAAVLPANARNLESTLAGLTALWCVVQTTLMFPSIAQGDIIESGVQWLPAAGLNPSVRIDGFAWMFCMLIFGIGTLVVLYARYYMSPTDPVPRFFAFLLAFMGAMAGVVVSGNLIELAFFWELTSLFSFLLIGYWHHRRDARRGARMSLTVTATGGLALLAAMLLLGHIVGSYALDDVLAAGAQVRAHPLYDVTLALVLLGAFTKSAQFPFHFWLPNAMAAPTPVSSYLHSATMVKAGVFLLARLWPVMGGTATWFWWVGGVGLTTLLLGGLLAMFQRDLKGVLAYSTISHLGLITLLLGLNSALAAVAAVFHIMNHATFKASLFMAAGIVDHESGTRDMQQLSGLRHMMPITATLAMVAAAAMAGVPLLNGFLSKEMFFAETVFLDTSPSLHALLPIAATLAGMFSVAYSLRFIASVFFGPQAQGLPRPPHEPTRWMRVPVELLVAICLVVGILPQWSVGPALATAARPVVGGHLPYYSLSVWHGLTTALLMSVIAMLAGIAIYWFLLRKHTPMAGRIGSWRLGSSWWFDRLTVAVTHGARTARRWAGTRRLQWQMRWIVVAAVAAAALPLWSAATHLSERGKLAASPIFITLWLTGAVCALAATWLAKYHRLAALILVGGTGLCTALTFLWFSAPDLALTQLAVEFVTTVLLLLGLRWLPQRIEDLRHARAEALRTRARRVSDGVIACLSGLGVAWLAYALMSRDFVHGTSTFFLENARLLGGGNNVVNVMLVDFRGFDTFGEIVVLAIVAATIYALLRRFRPAREAMDLPSQQRALPPDLQTDLLNPRHADDAAVGYLMVPAALARLLLPFTALVAIHLFMRGHDEPGGGFVAGLVFSLGLIVQYMISGTVWVESQVRILPERWMAVGLLLALMTGMGSVLLGYPFLTSHMAHLAPAWLGEIHIASAFFFDTGVAILVIGATLLTLTAIAHQSVRSHRHHVHLIAGRAGTAPDAPDVKAA